LLSTAITSPLVFGNSTENTAMHSLEIAAPNSSSNGFISTLDGPESLRSSMSNTSLHPSGASSLSMSNYSANTTDTASNTSGLIPPIPPLDSDWGALPSGFTPDFNQNFDFSGMAPLQPMHDLLYNDLVGITDDPTPGLAANAQTFYDKGARFQFEDEFTDDSFWNFMNQSSTSVPKDSELDNGKQLASS
jgi:hypothetical protein